MAIYKNAVGLLIVASSVCGFPFITLAQQSSADLTWAMAPGATIADRDTLFTLMKAARIQDEADTSPGIQLARETVAYMFYTGTGGVKTNCEVAREYFGAVACVAGGHSTMGLMFTARIDAEGCPLHQNREPNDALQIWNGLLNDTNVSAGLKKQIAKERQVLVYDNKDPVATSMVEVYAHDSRDSKVSTMEGMAVLVTAAIVAAAVVDARRPAASTKTTTHVPICHLEYQYDAVTGKYGWVPICN